MLGLADKTKLINLISYVFQGDEKKTINLLEDLIDSGLDAKNFLNDFLELLYLFGRRANLGPIEKAMCRMCTRLIGCNANSIYCIQFASMCHFHG